MSDRATLHASRLDAFVQWAKSQGYSSEPTKEAYEVARLRHDATGDAPLIFHKRDRTDHVTVPAGAASLVRRFIRQSRRPPA